MTSPLGAPSTTHLSAADFQNAYNSVAFANQNKWVLNSHISVTWSTVGMTKDEQVAAGTERLLCCIDAACHEASYPAAWICVIERGRVRGLHAHILLHGSKSRTELLKHWLRSQVHTISGTPPLVGTKGETVFVECDYDRHIGVQWSLFRYLMKGIHPEAKLPSDNQRLVSEVAGIGPEDEGTVIGPRLRVSKAINASARENEHFKSLLDDGCTDYAQLFSEFYFWDRPISEWTRAKWSTGILHRPALQLR